MHRSNFNKFNGSKSALSKADRRVVRYDADELERA